MPTGILMEQNEQDKNRVKAIEVRSPALQAISTFWHGRDTSALQRQELYVIM